MSLKLWNMSSYLSAIVKMFNFIGIDWYIALQVGVVPEGGPVIFRGVGPLLATEIKMQLSAYLSQNMLIKFTTIYYICVIPHSIHSWGMKAAGAASNRPKNNCQTLFDVAFDKHTKATLLHLRKKQWGRWTIFKLNTQKMISEPQTGIEPATFWWPVRRTNHWAKETQMVS